MQVTKSFSPIHITLTDVKDLDRLVHVLEDYISYDNKTARNFSFAQFAVSDEVGVSFTKNLLKELYKCK